MKRQGTAGRAHTLPMAPLSIARHHPVREATTRNACSSRTVLCLVRCSSRFLLLKENADACRRINGSGHHAQRLAPSSCWGHCWHPDDVRYHSGGAACFAPASTTDRGRPGRKALSFTLSSAWKRQRENAPAQPSSTLPGTRHDCHAGTVDEPHLRRRLVEHHLERSPLWPPAHLPG